MTATTISPSAVGDPGLVGRTAELDRVRSLLADGGGTGLVLRGDPGAGTSALLAAAAGQARRSGWRVVATTALRPYGDVRALLRAVTAGPAAGPVLLAVDDLQELDAPGRLALARESAAGPVVLLGTVRTGAPGLPGVPELAVGPLAPGPARELLDRVAADLDRPVRDRLAAEARGNPLALVELPVAWRESARPGDDVLLVAPPLTDRLARALAGEVGALPAATRAALVVAAVGTGCTWAEVAGAGSVLAGRWSGADVLRPAVAAGLVAVVGDAVRFRHPLAGPAVLRSAPAAQVTAAAAALATVLDGQPDRQVWQRARAATAPAAALAAELQRSVAAASPVEAVRRAHRAAELSPDPAGRAERLMLAAQHALELGRPDLARRLSGDAEAAGPPPAARARRLGLAHTYGGPGPGTVGELLELCATADGSDPALALDLLVAAATATWWSDPGPDVRDRIAASAARADPTGTDPRSAAIAALCHTQPPPPADPAPRPTPPAGRSDARSDGLLGLAAVTAGDPVRAVDLLAAAGDALREQGLLGLLVPVLGARARAAVALADGHRAGVAAAECRELARATGRPAWATYGLAAGAVAAALRGDAEEARATAIAAERSAVGRPAAAVLAAVRLARGLAWLGTGRPGEAYEVLRPLFRPGDPAYDRRELAGALGFLAEAAGPAGRRADALAVVDDVERLPRTPALAVAVTHARALLADDDAALTTALDAALDADLVRRPFARARLELAYGSRLRRHRRVTESRALLQSAADAFDLVAARPWAARARTELRAAGLSGRTAAAGAAGAGAAPAALSPQELEVARLAVEGLSNREIGLRLHLSPRTVGSHLYRIYPKLDVTCRAQLAARLTAAR